MTKPAIFANLLAAALLALLPGCANRSQIQETPTKAGLAARDVIDPPAQFTYEQQTNIPVLLARATQLREQARPAVLPPKRTALCLSGGGSYGAYSAGILCGWSASGGRPQFDVVTGISTGAIIAPFAFLGSQYDCQIKRFYTETETNQIFTKQVVRGLFGESLANNTPLARQMDEYITQQLVCEIAAEHRKGRRLYVGTTVLEGKRFVVWNLGEIASRGNPEEDRQLIIKILLGSSAIPGFFPPSEIPVNVDGRPLIEYHVDGGVSQALFMMPPSGDGSLYGMDVYCVVAGKLFDQAEAVKPRLLAIAGKSVSAIIYAQCRGDLFRLWTACQLSGANFLMTAIPQDFPAPQTSTEFGAKNLKPMFDEGVKQIAQGTAWRGTPPGAEPGEASLVRNGTILTVQPRR